MVSVILPAMQPLGASGNASVSPYGTGGSLEPEGLEPMDCARNSCALSVLPPLERPARHRPTVAGAVSTSLVIPGQAISGTGVASGTIISSLGTGTGGAGRLRYPAFLGR